MTTSTNTEQQAQLYQHLSEVILDYDSSAPLLVGINGKDASGKTILADRLAGTLTSLTPRAVIRISFDDYLNKESIRNADFDDEARGSYEHAFNFAAFTDHVLKPLGKNGLQLYRSKYYDLLTDSEVDTPEVLASPDDIFIIDGLFIYRSDLVNYWDIKILLEATDDVLIERGSLRDIERYGSIEAARQKYATRFLPSQDIYFGEEHPENVADIIIDNNDVMYPFISFELVSPQS
jgi:uridine kinase